MVDLLELQAHLTGELPRRSHVWAERQLARIYADMARRGQLKRATKDKRPACGARCRSNGGAPCLARVVVKRRPGGRVKTSTRCRMQGENRRGPRPPRDARGLSKLADVVG